MNETTYFPRWGVSIFNRAGCGHFWRKEPLNPKYMESACGLKEATANLSKESEPMLKQCKRCITKAGKLEVEKVLGTAIA